MDAPDPARRGRPVDPRGHRDRAAQRRASRSTTAADGRQGLDRFAAEPFDLVLLDVMLPRLDGLEVCRAIRRTSTVPSSCSPPAPTPSTSSSGSRPAPTTTSRSRSRCPSSSPASGRRCAAPGAGRATATRLHLGPLAIDLAGRTVTRDGREIPLTRTEFDLLVELARHAGQVLSRDVLLDRIWGYDYLGDSRLVDVAIRRLRAKIEADPAAPELILTVRGAGYKAAR